MSCGLAERTDDRLVLVHPEMAEIVTRSSDQLHYVQTILRVVESTNDTVDGLAGTLVTALEDAIAARYGPDFVPTPHQMGELARVIQDYRDLSVAVVTHQLDKALQQHMVSAVSDYTAGMVTSGRWEAADS